MYRMLLLLGLTVGTVAVTPCARAQSSVASPEYPFAEWRARLLQDVALTPVQRSRIDTIARATWLRMRALAPLMANADDTTKANRLRELRLQQAAAIRRVLTPEQRAAFERNHEAWVRARAGGGRRPAERGGLP